MFYQQQAAGVCSGEIRCVKSCLCLSWCLLLFPQDQSCLRSGEALQETSWRIPMCVSPWERMMTSVSSCATTAGANSTSTRLAFALGSATMATFTEEPLKELGQINFHLFLFFHENWRCLPEAQVFLPRGLLSHVSMLKNQSELKGLLLHNKWCFPE